MKAATKQDMSPPNLICIHNHVIYLLHREEFQKWLNSFIDDINKLSMEQTEEFCTRLLDRCTIEQKCFIERCLHQLMSYDFISGLPELPVRLILEYLDSDSLLTCRQVCMVRTFCCFISEKF